MDMKHWRGPLLLLVALFVLAAMVGGCSTANPMGAGADSAEERAAVIVNVAPVNAYGGSNPWCEASGTATDGSRTTQAEGDTSGTATNTPTTETTVDANASALPETSPAPAPVGGSSP